MRSEINARQAVLTPPNGALFFKRQRNPGALQDLKNQLTTALGEVF